MLWVVGTSVSIDEDGYYGRLAARVRAELGQEVTNLSVGDQTSIMGCMRVLAAQDRFVPGDVVVWEYSLLDTLLGGALFAPQDVQEARRMAWTCLLSRSVSIIVLMMPPRAKWRRRSAQERQAGRDARLLDLECIDVRDLFAELGIAAPATHYRDDRHPCSDSSIVELMARRVFEAISRLRQEGRARADPVRLAHWRSRTDLGWHWVNVTTLAIDCAAVETFRNNLTSIETVRLAIGAGIDIAQARRIVGIGVVSTHTSGGLWCGHADCLPASTRLPANLDFSFLLRSTTLPCAHPFTDRLVSAPDDAFKRGVHAAYGQASCRDAGPVAVFGALFEPAVGDGATLTTRLRWFLRRMPWIARMTVTHARAIAGRLYRRIR